MSHHAAKLPACANCQYAFVPGEPDEYCPRCGQQNHEPTVAFGHVAEEFLEGVFHFDGKVPRTLRLLLTRPGELTWQFLAGHRMPFVPPIRLYVFISFVFFLLLSLASGYHEESGKGSFVQVGHVEQRSENGRIVVGTKNAPAIIETDFDRLPEYPTDAQAAAFMQAHHLPPSASTRFAIKHLPHLKRLPAGELEHKIFKFISISMFVLMPLAALLLLLAYRRQRPFYLAHLIDAVHLHCFAFLLLSALLLLTWLPGPDWLGLLVAALALPLYLLLALRRLYRQSWLFTLLKGSLLMTGYSLLLAVALVGAVGAGLLLA